MENAVVLDLGDLAGQARRIVDQARLEADRIIEEARNQAQRLEREAEAEAERRGHEQGLEQGRRAGREEVLATLRPQLEQLSRSWSEALDDWGHRRHEMMIEAQEDVVVFALEVARKVVHRMIETDGGRAATQVASALELLGHPSGAEVRVHPDDRPLVEEALPGLLGQIDRARDVRLRDDPTITRGGCVVRTAGGEVDATIETQLDRIAEALVRRPEPGS
ncbi:MAG: FliH/SctL family protein [Planctomycetota bacterium]